MFVAKRNLWPIFIIILAWAAAVLSNYTPGTWLTGWDNLHPEFDFFLNVKRSLTAVWQEYQGPGLLGGMGHAADLPRQIMLWITSLVLPAQLLRWTWTFFMLLIGPLGVYALVRSIQTNAGSPTGTGMKHAALPALVAALFYLFNLTTVQIFTAPFDAFVTHYGVLPWLLWSNWEFLHAPSRKTLLLVAFINIIGMTHAYIPTLFLVYLILLLILCISVLIRSFNKASITRILSLGFITFCINAFWLLPFAHFTITKSPVTVGAKINMMATEEIYLQNKAFGDIKNVATLKSYWYNTADYNPTSGALEPVLGVWRSLEGNNWMVWVRYSLAALILFGGIIALTGKSTRVWGALGIVAIGMVAVDTPPFVWIIDWLRIHIPLFSQFFRFPFTKWGTALALSYSVWLGIGVWWILDRLKTYSSKIISVCVVLIPTSLAIIGAIGMLQGQLVSPKFKLTIPGDYFQLFSKMKELPLGRIANLPQNIFWGWTYYRWGYSGSGFLWYGIEHPILDRAFDVWTREGEQYYWELSRAIYRKDASAVEAVLSKYDVRYILLDESVISPSSDRGLFTPETKELLGQMRNIKEIARFGELTVYERIENDFTLDPRVRGDDKKESGNENTRSRSFISLKSNLPTVSPSYKWTDNDVVFTQLGDYVSLRSNEVTNNEATFTYPFRSLFTKRSIDEREFTVTETPDTITIGSISEATGASILKAHTIVYDSTKSAPARNASRSDAGGDLVADKVQQCGVLREGTAGANEMQEDIKPDQLPGTIPGIKLSNAINYLRFTSRNQRGCLSFSAGNLPHHDGHLVAVESRHISGRPLLFSLINQTAKHVELETYLQATSNKRQETSENWQKDYFILPPLAVDGLGYSVYLSNDAIGRQETINDLKSIKFYTIPYHELVSTHVSRDEVTKLRSNEVTFSVHHPNPAYYKIVLRSNPARHQLSLQATAGGEVTNNELTLILSQSFDPGWRAYTIAPCDKGQGTSKTNLMSHVSCFLSPYVPFLFGTEIKAHALVNNWANGWVLRSNEVTNNQLTIVLFFLPQLFQWLGFLLLPIPFIVAWRWRRGRQESPAW